MQSSFPVHAMLAATALLVAATANAQSSATSTLDLRFWLSDLDPSDAIAPTLTFDPNSRSAAEWATVAPSGSTSSLQSGASAFGAVSSSGSLDGAGGSASFSGDPLVGSALITASAVAGSLAANGSGTAFVYATASDQPWFMLSPHTQVVMAGSTTIVWNAGSPAGAAYGEIDLALHVAGSEDGLSMGYATAGYYGDGAGDVSGSSPGGVTVIFTNDSDVPEAVGFEVDVFANASEFETVPPPVDEPSNVGMLFAGASFLLWGMRRRRSSGA